MSPGESVDNPGGPGAEEGEGARSPLDHLYGVLGYAQAGHEGLRGQLEHERTRLQTQEQDLLQQRQAAHHAADQAQFDQLTAQWDELRRALQVIDHHLTQDPAHEPSEHPEGDERPGSEHGGSGDPGEPRS